MSMPPTPYRAMTLGDLARHLASAEDEMLKWRLIAEFLEEYRWEPADERPALLEAEPASTGDERWDVFLAALAEHLALRDHRRGPRWAEERQLERFWFPFNTRAARVDAIVHAPAAFRRRGIFVSPRSWRSRDHGLSAARPGADRSGVPAAGGAAGTPGRRR